MLILPFCSRQLAFPAEFVRHSFLVLNALFYRKQKFHRFRSHLCKLVCPSVRYIFFKTNESVHIWQTRPIGQQCGIHYFPHDVTRGFILKLRFLSFHLLKACLTDGQMFGASISVYKYDFSIDSFIHQKWRYTYINGFRRDVVYLKMFVPKYAKWVRSNTQLWFVWRK